MSIDFKTKKIKCPGCGKKIDYLKSKQHRCDLSLYKKEQELINKK